MAGMGESLDRFARGKLSPAESRELAQKALDDHDLFDELTSTALARRGFAARARQQITWPRVAILATAAAVIAGVALYAPHQNPDRPPQVAEISSPPVLLARNGDSNAAVFRGTEAASREPRATGSISAITAGMATIDVGSLDGLAKGAELDVSRDGQVIGHIRLTAIFRDHSRGEIVSAAQVRMKDQVVVPPAAQLRAALDQIAASLSGGDAGKAMGLAQQASVGTFDAGLSTRDDLNNAAVIAELHGDRSKAAELYSRALQASPSAQDRQVIEANLTRLKGAK
jgi:hypothetical protein